MATKVIIAPTVDQAILEHLDYVDINGIPDAVASIHNAQRRLVDLLSTFPKGGAKFTNDTLFFAVNGYVFIYDYDPEVDEVRVLDLYFPGQNWR